MYEDYFGLERSPFKITPDTSLFFEGGKRGDILAALVYAIQRGEGIVKVVGEVGSGKTMLCRMLQLRLPESVEIVYIANPSVSPEDILFVIAHELELSVNRDASKHQVMHILQDHLVERHMNNKQVVLFVEEAQGMPIETLEEIRLLSNLETDQNKLLQIVLFGQPELDQNLAQKSIRQLRERITHCFDLEPLSRDEIHKYLNFRMREVGYTGPELISQALAKKIEMHSEGLLRRINIIADKILLSAFAEGTHNLGAKHVNAAVEDSAFSSGNLRRHETLISWLLGIAAVLSLLVAIYRTWPLLNSAQLGLDTEIRQDTAIIDKSITDIAQPEIQTAENASLEGTESRDLVESEARQSESQKDPLGLTGQSNTEQSETVESDFGEPVSAAGSAASGDNLQRPSPDASKPKTESIEQATDMTSQQKQSGSGSDILGADIVARTIVAAVHTETGNEVQAAGLSRTSLGPSDDPRSAVPVELVKEPVITEDPELWLAGKLEESMEWLKAADSGKVSIQVMMRRKSAARELVYYLRNEWPLDISKTYLYEVNIENRRAYRVFYSEFDSLAMGRQQLEKLPAAVKINSPYLHSVSRMQKALL